MTDQERRLVDTMRKMGAVDAAHGKTGDDIMKVGKFAKGQLLAWIQALEKKGVVKRAPSTKSSHYYLVK